MTFGAIALPAKGFAEVQNRPVIGNGMITGWLSKNKCCFSRLSPISTYSKPNNLPCSVIRCDEITPDETEGL